VGDRARRALSDVEVGGWTVPAGSNIALNQCAMHNDARYYPDVEVRVRALAPREQEKRPEFSFFPFGGAPRICIGESFARMKAALLIAAIARAWVPRGARCTLVGHHGVVKESRSSRDAPGDRGHA